MDWEFEQRPSADRTVIPGDWLRLHYVEALNILFRLENTMRTFVFAVLKNEFQEKWDQCTCQVSGSERRSIKAVASQRIGRAETFGYLGLDCRAPLMQLNGEELVELITSDDLWPRFKHHFRGNRQVIRDKLLEISAIRDALTRFRPIRSQDVELIRQNSRHVLRGVRRCLQGLFHQPVSVPTNTSADWYRAITPLRSAHVNIALYSSLDETWINVRLTFANPPLYSRRSSDDHYTYTFAKINSANILRSHPFLCRYLTCLTESVSSPSLSNGYELLIPKQLNLIFRTAVLAKWHPDITHEIGALLITLCAECELLTADNLARGSIVEPAIVSARLLEPEHGGRWHFQHDQLRRPYQSEDPDEYWGDARYGDGSVDSIRRYPWMLEDISDGNASLMN